MWSVDLPPSGEVSLAQVQCERLRTSAPTMPCSNTRARCVPRRPNPRRCTVSAARARTTLSIGAKASFASGSSELIKEASSFSSSSSYTSLNDCNYYFSRVLSSSPYFWSSSRLV